jgi:acid phosphatase (class A)
MLQQFCRPLLVGMFALTSFGYCLGQDKIDTQCGTARGYYSESGKLSGRGSNPAVDTLKFLTPPETKNYVLSIRPYYLTSASALDFKIADPPANSSPQTLAEIAYLKQLEKGRTALEVDICKFMAGLSYNPRATEKDPDYKQYQQNLFQIGRSIGTWYNPDQLPETALLLGRVYQDASFFIWSFKYKYARIRPYTIDPTVNNLEDTDWPAYPSGHAGHSYVTALVLSMIAPEYHQVFMKDAYDIAHSREIIGVHFPSDSEASRVLACQIVEKLLADKHFQVDLEQARQEWKMKASELN